MSASGETAKTFNEYHHQKRSGALDSAIESKRVAIIGCGFSGLVCARECIREGLRVSIFEKKKEIGGTWDFEPVSPDLQTKNVLDDDWPSLSRSVQSSVFDGMRVNLPKEILGFTDFPFDDKFEGSLDHRRYCGYEEVWRYLKAFARFFDLEHLIHLETDVVNVEVSDSGDHRWKVEVKNRGKSHVDEFDAVAVSNGQYTVPNVAQIKGIQKFEKLCLHSHLYRCADPFEGKTVAIRGGSFSAREIGLEVGEVAAAVYICSRTHLEGTDIGRPIGKHQNVHFLEDIIECTGKGLLKLKDGRILENVDVLIFCTGYRYDFPFLEKSGLVKTDEGFVRPVYRHIFHPHHPTLAFTSHSCSTFLAEISATLCACSALPDRIIATMIAEFQSKYIARVFSGTCCLPDSKTMMDAIDHSLEEYKKKHGTLEYARQCRFAIIVCAFRTYHHLLMDQFDHMRSLAKDCGDVKPISEWREQMIIVAMNVLIQFPESFRDREMNDPCFQQAKQEMDAVRAHMSTHL